jgi:hypothetical protein
VLFIKYQNPEEWSPAVQLLESIAEKQPRNILVASTFLMIKR